MRRRQIEYAESTGKWQPNRSRDKAVRASTPAAVGAAGSGLSLVAVLAFVRSAWPNMLPWDVAHDPAAVAIVVGIFASLAAYWRTYTRDRKKHVTKSGLPE